MSIDYQAMVLEEGAVDTLWDKLAEVSEGAREEIITSTFAGKVDDGSYGMTEMFFDELPQSLAETDEQEMKVKIAEIDQAFLVNAASMKFQPEYGRGFMKMLGLFGEAVGIDEIDENGGGEDLVTTAEWISGFRSFAAEKQEAIKEELGGEQGVGWREFFDDFKQLRDIAKYCHEHGTNMIVCTLGDAVLLPYFKTRADRIYTLLKSTGKWD